MLSNLSQVAQQSWDMKLRVLVPETKTFMAVSCCLPS